MGFSAELAGMPYFDTFTAEDYRYILYPDVDPFCMRLIRALQDVCEGVVDDELSDVCAQLVRFPGYTFGCNSDSKQLKKQFPEMTDKEIDYFDNFYQQLYFCLRKALEHENVPVLDLFFKSSAKHRLAYIFCEAPPSLWPLPSTLFDYAVNTKKEYVLKKIIDANAHSMPLPFHIVICANCSDDVIRHWIKKIKVVPYYNYGEYRDTPHSVLLQKNKKKLLYMLLLKSLPCVSNCSQYISIDNTSFRTINRYTGDDFALFLYEIGALRCATRGRKSLYNQLLKEITDPSYNYDRISTFKMICALYSLIFENYDFGSLAIKQHFLQKVITYAQKQNKPRIEDLFKHILLFVDRNNEWMVATFCDAFPALKTIPEYAEYQKESAAYLSAREKARALKNSIFVIQQQRKIYDCSILTHN